MSDQLWPTLLRRIGERATGRRHPLSTRPLRVALLAVSAALLMAPAALADSLDERKAARDIGEQLDGYVGIAIENPPPELLTLVDRINENRREKYQAIAAKRQIDTALVAALAGEKLVARALPGHLVRDKEGRWRKRK